MNTSLSAPEQIALEHHLFDFPTNKTYEEILQLLKDESEEVQISSDFQYYDLDYLIELIDILKQSVINTLIEHNILSY